jgi:hypothetical protein
MLTLTLEEKEKFPLISFLFNVSLGALLLLGALSMAFANSTLGGILFFLGLLLLISNEYLAFRRLKIRGFARAKTVSPTAFLSGMLNFAILVLFPAALALVLYFGFGAEERVLLIVFASLAVASIKVAARTAELFLVK